MDFMYKHIHALREEDIILWQVKPTNTKTLSYYQVQKQYKLILLNPQS